MAAKSNGIKLASDQNKKQKQKKIDEKKGKLFIQVIRTDADDNNHDNDDENLRELVIVFFITTSHKS